MVNIEEEKKENNPSMYGGNSTPALSPLLP
jgi:hypothetical protein